MTASDGTPDSGRFSYVGDGGADEAEPVTQVHLRYDEYGGPFWDDEGCIGDDWHIWEPLGLTRETYEACMRWTGDHDEKGRLLRLLRDELPNEIIVESPSL